MKKACLAIILMFILVGHSDIVVAICADGEIGVANPPDKGKNGSTFFGHRRSFPLNTKGDAAR